MTHYRMDDQHDQPPRDGTLIDLWRDGERFTGKWHGIDLQWIYRCRFGTLSYADDKFFDRWSPIVPPPAEPQEPLPPEVEQDYQDFWKGIIERDGVIDLRQLKLELSDFRTVMRGAAKVYDHVTGGQVSKPNTDPNVVCSLADDHYRKCHEEDEPHESLIRWHGPDVAATWPDGSVVLSDNLSWLSLLTWRMNPHMWILNPEFAHWRYALIRRGGE